MNQKARASSTIVIALFALVALLLVGAAGSTAEPPSENPNPTEEECQPGQPYNRHCPTVVTFEFPKRSFFEDGKVKLVHLGCNMSCNHVLFTVKHGNRQVAKGNRWIKANYLPTVYTGIDGFAKKQLRRHKKLVVNARVCVHPPGPENFCKHAKIILKKK